MAESFSNRRGQEGFSLMKFFAVNDDVKVFIMKLFKRRREL